MVRPFVLAASAALALSGCLGTSEQPRGADGYPLPPRYRITASDKAEIPARVAGRLNALRGAQGVGAVAPDAGLDAAARALVAEMAAQNRPWLFTADGSSPFARAAQAGYGGQLLGEVISESFETELETLAAWMNRPDTRAVLLDPAAQQIGFAWRQERSGKIWWALLTGRPGG